jgi:hypothetical protein
MTVTEYLFLHTYYKIVFHCFPLTLCSTNSIGYSIEYIIECYKPVDKSLIYYLYFITILLYPNNLQFTAKNNIIMKKKYCDFRKIFLKSVFFKTICIEIRNIF